MRVALYHNLPPGGALRVVWEFARRAGREVECDLFTLNFGSADPFEYANTNASARDFTGLVGRVVESPVHAGVWVDAVGGRLVRMGLLKGVREAERRIATEINSGRYDVAYMHGCWFSQTPSILCDVAIPTVYYMQEIRRATFEPGYARRHNPSGMREVPGWAVEQWVEHRLQARDKQAASCADGILCNSNYSQGTIRNAYGRAATVAPLGLDEDMFSPAPGVVHRANRFLSIGGLEHFKGHHLIVEALSLIPVSQRPTLGLVYERCDNTYRDRLLALARELRVVIEEHCGIADAELADLLRRSAGTVLAAQLEPFGLVALESIATGTPVVAVNQAGYLESVSDGVNGFLVERSPRALAEGVERLMASNLNAAPARLRASVVPRWSWDTSVRSQIELLRDAVAGVLP